MRSLIPVIFTAITLFTSGCRQSSADEKAVLDPNTFEQMLNEKSDKVVLDVRTPEEYANGHIEYAVLMNVKEADFQKRIEQLDKDKPVFVYCASGIRSEKASVILKKSGFKEVYHLADGLKAWTDAHKKVTK